MTYRMDNVLNKKESQIETETCLYTVQVESLFRWKCTDGGKWVIFISSAPAKNKGW